MLEAKIGIAAQSVEIAPVYFTETYLIQALLNRIEKDEVNPPLQVGR